ncbi:hypothetical protein CLF_111895 [Clonorchis sinensis]|uniref:MD-2-related lipid-recognition domain-containing protein n=1 Tax=Clonorchis sinensis TaxID=79923 RepID=G7YM28_CLOSI|nr:hypothetical protein CLF_111895 [Clonorchis sinensis]
MHGEKGPEDITRIDAKKDLGIWLSPNLSFSLHLEKSAQKAFAVLRMIRRTFSRITRTDFQILCGAYVSPLLEYANARLTSDVILIERVQRAATKMIAGLKCMDYETRLAVLDLFPLEHRRLRGDSILTYALFEQGLANRFFTVDPANTRRGHGSHSVATRSVKISRCHIDPCVLFVGESVTIEVTFLAKADIVPGLFRLQSIIGGKVSDKIFVDDAVCSRFSPMCPIRSGGTYTYRFKGVVKRETDQWPFGADESEGNSFLVRKLRNANT